jgi:hypothetical protein
MVELKVNIWYKYQEQVIYFLAGDFKNMLILELLFTLNIKKGFEDE